MTKDDKATFFERMKGFIEVLEGYRPTKEKLDTWWRNLRGFQLDEVLAAMDSWSVPRMPKPIELKQLIWHNQRQRQPGFAAAFYDEDGRPKRYPVQPRYCHDGHPWYSGIMRRIERFDTEQMARFQIALRDAQAERAPPSEAWPEGEPWDEESAVVVAYGAVVTPQERQQTLRAVGAMPGETREWQHGWDGN